MSAIKELETQKNRIIEKQQKRIEELESFIEWISKRDTYYCADVIYYAGQILKGKKWSQIKLRAKKENDKADKV